MVFIDITDEIPADLGSAYTSPSGSTANTPVSIRWDCSIGGIPFLFANSKQFPMKRETATFRRDRIDTERNPGEQSLDSGFWLRSQASWHYGSGLTSAEPLEVSAQEAAFRYKTGGGVDPWTAGQLSLLKDTSQIMASTGSSQFLVGVDTGVLHADGTTVKYITNAGANSAVTWGGSINSVTSLTTDGANYYAANSTGIYKGTLPNGAGSLVWNTGSTTVARFVKSRLMACVGLGVYELTGTGPTLPTALYTHPSTGWTWTDIAEGPVAIYLSGYVGDQSYIYKVAVTSSSSTVTLSVPTVVAELPRGEKVLSLYSYVGAYLAVGTSKGVRIAIMDSTGSLSMGPLVVETSDGSYDAVADSSFLYVTVGSKGEAGNRVQRAGLYRIDLGTNLNGNSLDFPSAPDLVAPAGTTGSATQVTASGGYLWFAVTGSGVYKQADTYVSEGWLETGRIRMGTVENKAWRSVRITGDSAYVGSTSVYATTSESGAPSTWTFVVQNSATDPDQYGALNTAVPGPQSSIYLAFKLATSTPSVSPVFQGYQLKCVPAPKRTELVQVQLMCFDHERDQQNVPYGTKGGAWLRFTALKDMERSQSTIQWLDYTTGEQAEAFIEQVSWDRTTPPTRNATNSGGVVSVLLRLV